MHPIYMYMYVSSNKILSALIINFILKHPSDSELSITLFNGSRISSLVSNVDLDEDVVVLESVPVLLNTISSIFVGCSNLIIRPYFVRVYSLQSSYSVGSGLTILEHRVQYHTISQGVI